MLEGQSEERYVDDPSTPEVNFGPVRSREMTLNSNAVLGLLW